MPEQVSLFASCLEVDDSKTCSKCGSSWHKSEFGPDQRNRDGLQSNCRTCQRTWRLEHIEHERNYRKQYQKDNIETEKAKLRRWRVANPDRVRAQQQRARENINASELRRERKLSGERERSKRYYQANPEKWRVHSQTRRARVAGAGGKFTKSQWVELKLRYDCKCLRCGRSEPDIKLTIDHVVPISRGGSNNIDNIQPLCFPCNMWKKTKTIDFRTKCGG